MRAANRKNKEHYEKIKKAGLFNVKQKHFKRIHKTHDTDPNSPPNNISNELY